MGGIVSRRVEVGVDTCLLGTSGRVYIQSHAFDASTLSATGGVNEVQVATIAGSPTGGTFTLKYRGQETAAIAYNAAASAVQTALRALSNIGATGVTVTGSAGGPYTITFGGPLGNTDVFMLQLGTSSLTGGTSPSVAITQPVMGATYDPRIQIGSPTLPGTIVAEVPGSSPKRVREYTAAGAVAEQQTITESGAPTGGTFRLNYRGDVTDNIAYNASAAAIATALNALDTIAEDGGVATTGGALPGTGVVVTFNDEGVRPTMTINNNALTGGTSPAPAVAKTTTGADAEEIYGLVDGQEEFITNTSAGNRDVAVHGTYCVFDARKIKNFALYEDEFRAWCAANFNRIRHDA